MIKHKKIWLSKIVGMSYNLERREYHILRHVRELISINLNWVSRKVYIGVSVFFFHLTLMISIHPTKGCNYWFSENRRPGQPILVLQIPRPVPFFFISIRNSQPKSTYFVHRACIHSYSCEEGIFVTRNSSISQGRCSLFVFLLDLTKLCCGLNMCSCLCTASPCPPCCSPCRRNICPCIPLPCIRIM